MPNIDIENDFLKIGCAVIITKGKYKGQTGFLNNIYRMEIFDHNNIKYCVKLDGQNPKSIKFDRNFLDHKKRDKKPNLKGFRKGNIIAIRDASYDCRTNHIIFRVLEARGYNYLFLVLGFEEGNCTYKEESDHHWLRKGGLVRYPKCGFNFGVFRRNYNYEKVDPYDNKYDIDLSLIKPNPEEDYKRIQYLKEL